MATYTARHTFPEFKNPSLAPSKYAPDTVKSDIEAVYNKVKQVFGSNPTLSWEDAKNKLIELSGIDAASYASQIASTFGSGLSASSEVIGMLDIIFRFNPRIGQLEGMNYERVCRVMFNSEIPELEPLIWFWFICRTDSINCLDRTIFISLSLAASEQGIVSKSGVVACMYRIEYLFENDNSWKADIERLKSQCAVSNDKSTSVLMAYKLEFVMKKLYPGFADLLESWFKFEPGSDLAALYDQHKTNETRDAHYLTVQSPVLTESQFDNLTAFHNRIKTGQDRTGDLRVDINGVFTDNAAAVGYSPAAVLEYCDSLPIPFKRSLVTTARKCK